MGYIYGILIKQDGEVDCLHVLHDVKVLREVIGCRCLDITSRYIGGKLYYIVCDDEFLLNGSLPTAYYIDGSLAFCGNIFIVNFDGRDDICSLEKEDVKRIYGHIYDNNLILDCF